MTPIGPIELPDGGPIGPRVMPGIGTPPPSDGGVVTPGDTGGVVTPGDTGGVVTPGDTGGAQTPAASSGNFTVVSQRRTVQQLATGSVIDVEAVGFQTQPHGVYCEALVPLADWTNGNSATYINPVATAIESIMSTQPVSSASFAQDVDPATNLLADFEDFIVSYSPPGALASMTTTVRISVGQLAQGAAGLPTALIQAAYATLQHTAGL